MPHGTKELRLFVAIYPPEGVARAMLRSLRKLEAANHKPTSVEQIHLTLQFIGPTSICDLEQVQESVARSVAGLERFELALSRLRTLPARGRPRLICCETDTPPPLLEIQRRLATRLSRHVRRDPGDRFTPHLTLCRFTRDARPWDIDPPVQIEAFAVDQIRLMKSVLRPEGAEHSIVEAFALGS